jgi:GT2 family glycosyltransferase
VSVVLHNNGRWLDGFVESVLALDYPADRLSIHFVDNASTDATPQQARAAIERLKDAGIEGRLIEQANLGFGAGHSAGLRGASAPFALVTNVDLTFERLALKRVVASALSDEPAAAWELRQKPYEHPKFYDPVTGETNWNSHACVLLRRTAFEAVGGYDHHLFMYGEDVELSYRLRRAGWLLRYCPAAVVFHYSYESAGQVKPLQYTGSTFANLYLRMKYGTLRQMAMVPAMAMGLLVRPEPYPGARKATLRSLGRLLAKAPAALAARRSSEAVFSFRLWDYELRRDGAFHEVHELPADAPLVSVITRTYAGRSSLLREAMLSVAHQSYPNIELVVVEDGGETLREVVEETSRRTGLRTRYAGLPKSGRSAAGNAGLAAATGRWCVFLDDDDLLFADHVEVLVQALMANPSAVGAYSPSWEVQTRYTPDANMPYEEVAYTVLPVLRQPFERELLKERNYIAIQSLLFERRLFQERGGFDVGMDALEDWILWNVYAHDNVFEYVPKITSLFRTPADVAVRQRRNEIFAQAYEPARARFAERIAGVIDARGPHDVPETTVA